MNHNEKSKKAAVFMFSKSPVTLKQIQGQQKWYDFAKVNRDYHQYP